MWDLRRVDQCDPLARHDVRVPVAAAAVAAAATRAAPVVAAAVEAVTDFHISGFGHVRVWAR